MQPKKELVEANKFSHRMSSVELWSTGHYLRVLNEGNLTLKKSCVDQFRRLKKRYQTLRNNPHRRKTIDSAAEDGVEKQ